MQKYDYKVLVITAICLLMILAFDGVLLSYGAKYTLSRVYTRFNSDYPVIGHTVSFVFGVLIGHWFIGVKDSVKNEI